MENCKHPYYVGEPRCTRRCGVCGAPVSRLTAAEAELDAIVAAVFGAGPRHPFRDVVERVLRERDAAVRAYLAALEPKVAGCDADEVVYITVSRLSTGQSAHPDIVIAAVKLLGEVLELRSRAAAGEAEFDPELVRALLSICANYSWRADEPLMRAAAAVEAAAKVEGAKA